MLRVLKPIRRLTALAIVTLVFAAVASSSPRSRPEALTGSITGTGITNIDGMRVVSGQTLFSPSEITTTENSASLIEIRNLAQLRLAAKTHLALEFSRQDVLGSLYDGQIVASIPAGVQAQIVTADASVLTSGSEPVVFTISVDGCITSLSVHTGSATISVGDKVHSIVAGEEFSTAPGSQATPKKSSDRKKKIGLFLGIGAAVALLVAVFAGKSSNNEISTPGGCVVAPSGPTITPCG